MPGFGETIPQTLAPMISGLDPEPPEEQTTQVCSVSHSVPRWDHDEEHGDTDREVKQETGRNRNNEGQ